ncbi:MAG: hypothetical protein LBV44_04250 [Methylobacillus sp.]|jgi:hypothetical protein|nr:hypothetical protein [Methylobacillus sp.]
MKNLKWALIALAMTFCGAARADVVSTGIVAISEDGTLTFYFPKNAPPGATVFYQWTEKGRVRCCKILRGDELTALPEPASDWSVEQPMIVYGAKMKHPLSPKMETLGLALSADKATPQGKSGIRGISPGKTVEARWCLGTEGINVIEKISGRYRTTYIGFGYEIESGQEPRCSASDLKIIGKN